MSHPSSSRGSNTVEIRFRSPESEAAARATSLSYPVPHQIYPSQSMHRNLLRKVQCHSSWDWGIALMVSGIYGSIRIRKVEREALHAAWTLPRPAPSGRWEIPVHIEWDRLNAAVGSCELPVGPPEAPVTVTLTDGDGRTVAAWDSRDGKERGRMAVIGRGHMVVTLDVEDPDPWWPAGYGDQPRYTLTVTMGTTGGQAELHHRFPDGGGCQRRGRERPLHVFPRQRSATSGPRAPTGSLRTHFRPGRRRSGTVVSWRTPSPQT